LVSPFLAITRRRGSPLGKSFSHLARYEGVKFVAAAVGLCDPPMERRQEDVSDELYACWVKLLDEAAWEKAVRAAPVREIDRVERMVFAV